MNLGLELIRQEALEADLEAENLEKQAQKMQISGQKVDKTDRILAFQARESAILRSKMHQKLVILTEKAVEKPWSVGGFSGFKGLARTSVEVGSRRLYLGWRDRRLVSVVVRLHPPFWSVYNMLQGEVSVVDGLKEAKELARKMLD